MSVSFLLIVFSCFLSEVLFGRDVFIIYESFFSGVMVISVIFCVLVEIVFWLMIICEDGFVLNVTG